MKGAGAYYRLDHEQNLYTINNQILGLLCGSMYEQKPTSHYLVRIDQNASCMYRTQLLCLVEDCPMCLSVDESFLKSIVKSLIDLDS